MVSAHKQTEKFILPFNACFAVMYLRQSEFRGRDAVVSLHRHIHSVSVSLHKSKLHLFVTNPLKGI